MPNKLSSCSWQFQLFRSLVKSCFRQFDWRVHRMMIWGACLNNKHETSFARSCFNLTFGFFAILVVLVLSQYLSVPLHSKCTTDTQVVMCRCSAISSFMIDVSLAVNSTCRHEWGQGSSFWLQARWNEVPAIIQASSKCCLCNIKKPGILFYGSFNCGKE